MRVVILCGGRGTRLQSDAPELPKPLVEVGGRPILWHVIRLFARATREVILCTGYRSELIERFAASTDWPAGLRVRCVETGLDTPTGGRLHRVAELVGEETFMVTYADGLADLDLAALLAAHRAGGALATVTVVRPELPFGVAELAGDRVTGFHEKPRAQQWINGGFFVFEPGALDYLSDDAVLEREPLQRLAADGRLHAFRHEGFWACMDTYKDAVALNDLWTAGDPPWARGGAAAG